MKKSLVETPTRQNSVSEGTGMQAPPAGDYEQQRLSALRRYGILDTEREAAFDDLAKLAGYLCEAPISVINFIDQDRQWFKAEVGLGIRQTELDVSICAHAILQKDFFVVPDTLEDPRFANNPLVTGEPYLRFYAGALLETSDGYPLGTFCVLDYKPRQLTQEQIDLLSTLARQVMMQLELMHANILQAEMLEELEKARDALAKQAATDELTGLANRRAFDERLNQHIALVQRGAPPASLMMADLDFFKRINDQFGHYVGDEALRNFADLCREVFRATDVIGRWGGEEFVFLLPNTELDEAEKIAQRLHTQLAQNPLADAEEPVYVSASVGIVALDAQRSAAANLQLLDDTLYSAKAQGRSRTVLG